MTKKMSELHWLVRYAMEGADGTAINHMFIGAIQEISSRDWMNDTDKMASIKEITKHYNQAIAIYWTNREGVK